ncbi:hypothetical protein [Niallia sp. Krafla_26]|uniref:hypothetical protein n=1 Tax=Niallia sp. Krafla_26 TaxID=3064703 RepID=UPI003D17E3EC
MLSFEEKRSIFRSYKDLIEKPTSNGRINYEYPKSQQRGKILATQLHDNGNGYVIGKYLEPQALEKKAYKLDSRGWINIKEFTESELHEIIQLTMNSMNHSKPTVRKKILITERYSPTKIEVQAISESLVRSCLYNWIGYGNLNGPVWFLGMEEEGTEIWRNQAKTLEESLRVRSSFNLKMGFSQVWEELYKIPLEAFNDSTRLKYVAAFLLELSGEEVTTKNIEDYVFQERKLGEKDSDHFLGVFRPLPKKRKGSIEPYQSIWESMEFYEKEIEEKRFALIKENLISHPNVQLLITYDDDLTEKLLNFFADSVKKLSWWEVNGEKYSLHQINLSKGRNVLLLSTPFFTNDQISYKGIIDCIKRVNRLKQWAL